jgi:glucose/arabinose dehydrogenase
MKNAIYTLLFLCVPAFSLFAQPSIDLVEIASGLDEPVDISHAGDERLFIVEKDGRIRIIDGSGNVLATPFLDITDRVLAGFSERGLLGLAFHPDYASNGYFYVNYTAINGNGDTRISRFERDPGNPNLADPNSEVVVLQIDQPFNNHNGGELIFGPDGYLYIGMGDGGLANDPQNNSQTPTTLLGKMLRIDVDNQDPGLNYAIPPDNPWADPADGVRDEIWAFGLRNPWRFSFDRLTGDMWIGDVGQGEWEEIDFQPAGSAGGENYGWRCYEGNHPAVTSGCGPMSDYDAPVFEYSHSATGGCSITGGFVYRGCDFPNLWGHYLYVDYCTGQFWALAPDGMGGWQNFTLSNLANLNYVTFGEDFEGELYVAALGQGRIYRITEISAWVFETVATVENESCEGSADGSISLEWPPVIGPVEVEWDNAATGPVLENLSAGEYCAVVSRGGCPLDTLCAVVAEDVFSAPEIVEDVPFLVVPAGYASYQWYFEGTVIPDANDTIYLPLQTGGYTVEVTNEAGCTAISEEAYVIVQSAAEAPGAPAWQLSPNPFTTWVDLQVALPAPQDLRLEIFHSDGRRMWEGNWMQSFGIRQTLDTGSWPSGVYWVRLQTGEGQWVRKLIRA